MSRHRPARDRRRCSRRTLARAAFALLTAVTLATWSVAPAVSAGDRPPEGAVVDADDLTPDPLPAPGNAPFLGVWTEPVPNGLRVVSVVPASPAAHSGLDSGDVVRGVSGRRVEFGDDLAVLLAPHAPGDRVHLDVLRDAGPAHTLEARLGVRRLPDPAFRGTAFRLAVVPLRFADEPTDDPFDGLDALFFGRRTAGGSASVADYVADQSGGVCRLVGRIAPPLALQWTRAERADEPMGGRAGSLYHDAVTALVARDGAAALAGMDGVAFVVKGDVQSRPGRAFWPHRAEVFVDGLRVPYFVHPVTAGGREIGGHCHELGHLLGLQDEYGEGHRTGSGDFCLMSLGHRGGAERGAREPFALCAPCRLRLGWLRGVVVDPRVPRRLRIRPVDEPGAGSGQGRAVIVPLDRRCEEYLVLAVRARRGFDRALPSAGLLVWHVGGPGTPGQGTYRPRVDLIEAHGVDTFDATLVRTDEIAFPTARAEDLTPDTVPFVRGREGAFTVHLTDMCREPDGAVVVTLGVPRSVRQTRPFPYVPTAPERDGAVVRPDPITGEVVRFYPHRRREPQLPLSTSSERR